VIVMAFAVFDQDPFATLFTWATGIGAIAVIFSQLVAAVAIFVFFRRATVDKRLWNTAVAPVLSILGLTAFLVLTLGSLDVLLAVKGTVAALMVALVFVALLAGMAYGLYLQRTDPIRYGRLGQGLDEPAPDAPLAEAG
jgi:amino acid transporter